VKNGTGKIMRFHDWISFFGICSFFKIDLSSELSNEKHQIWKKIVESKDKIKEISKKIDLEKTEGNESCFQEISVVVFQAWEEMLKLKDCRLEKYNQNLPQTPNKKQKDKETGSPPIENQII
jgi:hypothetical protein